MFDSVILSFNILIVTVVIGVAFEIHTIVKIE